MVILKFALKRTFRNPVSMLASFILPVVFMLIPDLWDSSIGGMVGGRGLYLIALVMMFGTFPLTSGMVQERKENTVIRIMSTPTTAFSYLAQNLIASLVPLMIQIFLVSILGFALRGWSLEFTFGVFAAFMLFASASTAFCFAWNCLFKKRESTMVALSSFLTFATFILIFPLTVFPQVIKNIFMAFPTFWIASAFDNLIAYGIGGQFLITLAILALFTITFLMYGSKRGTY